MSCASVRLVENDYNGDDGPIYTEEEYGELEGAFEYLSVQKHSMVICGTTKPLVDTNRLVDSL